MAAQNAEMTSSTIDLTACVKEQDKVLLAQTKVYINITLSKFLVGYHIKFLTVIQFCHLHLDVPNGLRALTCILMLNL